MKIIVMNEDLGIIWYTSKDYKQNDVHVVIYGLSRTEWVSREQAQLQFNKCLHHAFNNN